jgi:hypothetical protein
VNRLTQATEERIGLGIELFGCSLTARTGFEMAGNFAGDQIGKFTHQESAQIRFTDTATIRHRMAPLT